MKSRVIQKEYEYVLSIGMIVKNEEKNLPACLNALKPLLDGVKSELVIVDTGSADKTVEIAEKFTDKVHFFEWTDDFSAARNFGLTKCSGEWFMFLDADEVFDSDMGEMVEFWNNRKFSKGYNSATHVMKNYTDAEKTVWNIFTQSRIVRLLPDIKFVNPIHERYTHFYGPTYEFKTFSEHYGYIYGSKEEEEAKKLRNRIPLMKEYEKNPQDLNTALMLLRELPEREKEPFLKKIMAVAGKGVSRDSDAAFLHAISHYYMKNDYSAVVNLADEYLKLFKNESVIALDIYAIKGSALDHLGDEGGAVRAYESYLKLYGRYEKGGIDVSPLRKTSVIFADAAHYEGLKGRYREMIKNKPSN